MFFIVRYHCTNILKTLAWPHDIKSGGLGHTISVIPPRFIEVHVSSDRSYICV
jgi:hypothetical protein